MSIEKCCLNHSLNYENDHPTSVVDHTTTSEINDDDRLDQNSTAENTIAFTDEDLEGIEVPHNDDLVVTMTVANTRLHKILVDTGSSFNKLSIDVLEQMKLTLEKDVDCSPERQKTVVARYGGEAECLGEITLSVTAGTEPRSATVDMDFIVVDSPSEYDVTLGRPGLQALRAVPSTYHLLLRFPTKSGIGQLRGHQLVARECRSNECLDRSYDELVRSLCRRLKPWGRVFVVFLTVLSLFQSFTLARSFKQNL